MPDIKKAKKNKPQMQVAINLKSDKIVVHGRLLKVYILMYHGRLVEFALNMIY